MLLWPKQLEDSLHGFFGDSQLSVDVYDNDGIHMVQGSGSLPLELS